MLEYFSQITIARELSSRGLIPAIRKIWIDLICKSEAGDCALFKQSPVNGNQGRLHDEIRGQFAFALRQLDPENLNPQRWSLAQTQDRGHDRSETRYSMSSLEGVRTAEMLGDILGHWAIENRCHWVLDTIYREDHNQTHNRTSAANHSTRDA